MRSIISCSRSGKHLFTHLLLLGVIEVRENDFFALALGFILHAYIFLSKHALTKGLIVLLGISADARLILHGANRLGATSCHLDATSWHPWMVSIAAKISTLSSTASLGTGMRA